MTLLSWLPLEKQDFYQLGVTGSRNGATDKQMEAVHQNILAPLLVEHGSDVVLHHGNCVGVDEWLAALGRYFRWFVAGHPATSVQPTLQLTKDSSHLFYGAKKPLVRNKNIVAASNLMVAVPDREETTRSGTWSTVRYARKIGVPIAIVFPDGFISFE